MVNLHRDGCIKTKRYEEITVNSFLGEVSKFIDKWEIDMVPIEFAHQVMTLKNTTNNLTPILVLETRFYRKLNSILIISYH